MTISPEEASDIVERLELERQQILGQYGEVEKALGNAAKRQHNRPELLTQKNLLLRSLREVKVRLISARKIYSMLEALPGVIVRSFMIAASQIML